MEYLLFAGYLFLFAWIATKIKFFTDAGFTSSKVIIIFLLKVMAGVLYGWVGIYYTQTMMMVDTWNFHYLGLEEYRLLRTNAGKYFTNLFTNSSQADYFNFLIADNSFWYEIRIKAMAKLISIFDIFSFGNYFINIIFYSFLSLFGPFCLYRVMKDVFPGKNIPVAIASFFIPSTIYWCSGIHKDGLIFTAICFIVYGLYFSFKKNRFTSKRIFLIILGFILISLLRSFLLIIIIPAVIAWYTAVKVRQKPFKVFALIYLFSGILFFTAKYIHSKFDFPAIVVFKQKEFMNMQGGSKVFVKELQPTVSSFLKRIPQALDLSLLRPHPADVINLLALAAAVELYFLLLLFILFVFFRTRGSTDKTFLCFCLFFSFSMLLTIGYTVNFVGAIVRYKSLILPFLIVPIVALTDWRKIGKLFLGIDKNVA